MTWELTEDEICGRWCEREVGGWTWAVYMLVQGGSHRPEITLDDEN